MITPIIMAGGVGSRLWPLSRVEYPKQFLKLNNDFTMLQNTLLRLEASITNPPIVISNNQHRFLVAEQLNSLGKLNQNIILEPEGRNTAPAIALSALHLINNNDDALMLVLAADHIIEDAKTFNDAISEAIQYAQHGKIVTFGIQPTQPETGYGYIKRGKSISHSVYEINSFFEKPNMITAQEYFEDGDYFWNSGIFLVRASTYINELKSHRPEIYETCKSCMNDAIYDCDFIRVNEKTFSSCISESVDYAIMENTKLGVVIPVSIGWSDVGSWSMLWAVSDKNEAGNSIHGDVITQSSKNNYIYSDSGLVSTVGVDDLIIIQTRDATLVMNKNCDQDIKHVVDKIKKEGRSEVQKHFKTYRPWGNFELMDKGERFKVRKVTLKPKEKLTNQMHLHRAEHWIIVSGTAKVTIEGNSKFLSENESTYIPLGVMHQLENPGVIPLEIIEVQSGIYLEEDDVFRL